MSFSEADRMELDSTYSSSRKWDFLPDSSHEGRRFDWRSCLSAKPIEWNWIPPTRPQENGTFAGQFSWRTKIWLEVKDNLQVLDDLEKNLVARAAQT